MAVLQISAGEEGGCGGLPNLLKEDEKKEDGEEKKGDDEEKEEMEGTGGMRRRCRTASL